jgi:hypothetical protein
MTAATTTSVLPYFGRRPLFRQAMGGLFHALSAPVRAQHGVTDVRISAGRCDIDRGGTWFSRVVGWAFRFPPAGRDLPTQVTVIADRGREIWYRDFDGNGIYTVLQPRSGIRPGPAMIVEKFGLVGFDLELQDEAGALRMRVRGMKFGPCPLPRWIWPDLRAVERAESERFIFDIDIRLPGGELLIHYCGWLNAGLPGEFGRAI